MLINDLSPVRKLRPAILVVLRTSIDGAVSYRRLTLEANHAIETGEEIEKWETTRVVRDPEEYAEAVKVRAEIRNGIAAVCSVTSAFGLMAPVERAEALSDAISKGRSLAADFNAKARGCSVSLSVLRGEIAADDAEAIRAVSAEVSAMLRMMREGIKASNPAAIRKAAAEAKALAAVLSNEGRAAVNAAIREARDNARAIVKRIGKAGERAARVVESLDTSALDTAARTFLDIDNAPAPDPQIDLIPAAIAPVDIPDEIPAESGEEN